MYQLEQQVYFLYTSFSYMESKKQNYLHVSLQLFIGHGEVRMVVVVERHITAGLVQH